MYLQCLIFLSLILGILDKLENKWTELVLGLPERQKTGHMHLLKLSEAPMEASLSIRML